MGLYLCVFKDEEEKYGVEVGSYDDFGVFRDRVLVEVENNIWGSICPILMMHSDCDGYWTKEEALILERELSIIKNIFTTKPAIEPNCEWKIKIIKLLGLKPSNLYESFIDIDGELLIDRLINLCNVSIKENESILFQ